MAITLSSVLNIVLFSGIAIVLIQVIIRKADILLLYGFRLIQSLMIALLIRFFIPIELPTQNVVSITEIWPDIYIALTKPFTSFAGREWSWLSFFIIVSVAGSLFFAVKLVVTYFAFRYKAKQLETINDSLILGIVDAVNASYGKNVHFEIVRYNETSSPIIFGLRKPYILLPDLDLTKEEWTYVLSHEMSHYYNKDLWIRFLCEMLQALYWWNPFVYIFRKQITKVQELRADAGVMDKLSRLKRLEYTECLIRVAKQHTDCQQKWVASFSSDSETDVVKRISLLLQRDEFKGNRTIKSGLTVLLLVFMIVFLPNFCLIEPFSMAEEDKGQGIYLDRSNTYFVLNADGLYDVYVEDEYFVTVQEVFDDSFKIYDENGGRIK